MKDDKKYIKHKEFFDRLPIKFTTKDLIAKLKGNDVKYDKNFLTKLLSEGKIRSIDSRTYQKNIGFDDIEKTKNVKKFEELSKIAKDESIIKFSQGFTNIITGIKDFDLLPEWKKTILKFAFERLNAVFIIIHEILSYSNKYPSKNSRQYREILLEILPHVYSRKYHWTEIENIIKNVFLSSTRFSDNREEAEKILEIYDKKSGNKKDKWNEITQFLEKFSVLITPRLEFSNKEEVRALIDEGVLDKKSSEEIAWSILVHQDNFSEITEILKEYSDKLDIKKIERYLKWVILGKKIAPLLYKADFHYRVLRALENKTLKEGFYYKGKLQSRKSTAWENDYMDNEDGHWSIIHGYPMFNRIKDVEYLRIYDSDHHAEILNDTTMRLKELFKEVGGFKEVIVSLVFTNNLIAPSPNEAYFRYGDLKLLEFTTEKMGYRHTKSDMKEYLGKAEQIRKDYLLKMFGRYLNPRISKD